jgi:hypothetical protein
MSDNGSVGPTKGPWGVHGSHIYAPDGEIIAQVYNPGSGASDYPLVLNRDLMAAAPELAEALKLLVDRFDTIDGKPFVSPPDSPWSIARAALQKAGLSAGEGC